MILWVDFRSNFVQMLVRILKKRNPPWFWRVPSPYLDLEHAKTIGKQSVFVACMHHAREPGPFLCEKGLVVESGAVFYTTLWAHFPRTNRKTTRSLLQGRRFLGPPLF